MPKSVPQDDADPPQAKDLIDPRVLQEVSLQYFLEVVRSGSVTEAAARLGVAPSAVSRQIARLERGLDTLLFHRKARGMELNAAGELVAVHAQRAWLDIERLLEEVYALRGVRKGHVRLAATEGFAYEFLPAMVAQFQAQKPGIVFALQVCEQAEVVRRVRDGEVDAGITVGMVSESSLDVALRHPSPLLAVVRPEHPLARRQQITLIQALAYPMALPSSSTSRRLLDISCSRQGLSYEASFVADRLYPLINYVGHTEAITFCGELALRQHLRTGVVCGIPLRDREMNERHFEIQTLAGRHLTEAARAFIDQVRQVLVAEG